MRILPPPLDLSVANFENNDLFGRGRLAAGLTKLLGESDDPLVIALDGEWGTGKSTFLAMWTDQLKAGGFPVVKFDAFEHDYVEDPFLALAGEIIELAEKLRPREGKAATLLRAAKGVGGVLLKTSLNAGIKLATLGSLDVAKASDDMKDVISDAVESATDTYIEERLTKHAEQKNALLTFRQALEDLPRLLAKSNNDPIKPLVFVIDELDRCRPAFALQTLERIKHFFAVPGVHFVFGVNLNQLRNSVKTTYGVDMDAGLYLQKFITLTYHLSDRAGSENLRASRIYIDYISGEMPQILPYIDLLKIYSARNSLNLRSIERIITNISLSISVSPKPPPPQLLSVLAILKVMHPEYFLQAKSGGLNFQMLRPLFGFSDSMINPPPHPDDPALWWGVCLGGAVLIETSRRPVTDCAASWGVGVGDFVPLLANELLDALTAN